MIVEDALRRFSQDKTSMADYALESGGQNQLLKMQRFKSLHKNLISKNSCLL